MIRIKSKKDGFRRCGIAHSKEAVQYPDDRFSAGELAVLRAEPTLVVEIMEIVAPAAAERPDNAEPGIQTDAGEPPAEPARADVSDKEPAKPAKKGKR